MLFLFGSGLGLMAPSIDRTLVGAVSSAQRASVMGMTSSMIWLGQTIGPALFPLLATDVFAQSGGYSYLFLVFGSATILGGVVTIATHHVTLS
jgi:MFS family permease